MLAIRLVLGHYLATSIMSCLYYSFYNMQASSGNNYIVIAVAEMPGFRCLKLFIASKSSHFLLGLDENLYKGKLHIYGLL